MADINAPEKVSMQVLSSITIDKISEFRNIEQKLNKGLLRPNQPALIEKVQLDQYGNEVKDSAGRTIGTGNFWLVIGEYLDPTNKNSGFKKIDDLRKIPLFEENPIDYAIRVNQIDDVYFDKKTGLIEMIGDNKIVEVFYDQTTNQIKVVGTNNVVVKTDLAPYMKTQDAINTFQPLGDYAVKADLVPLLSKTDAANLYVAQIAGMGLSKNDFNDTYKAMLDNLNNQIAAAQNASVTIDQNPAGYPNHPLTMLTVTDTAANFYSTEFTAADKFKLDGLEYSNFLGKFNSEAEFRTKHPTGEPGKYGYVTIDEKDSVGNPTGNKIVVEFVWNENKAGGADWQVNEGASTVETPASIKQKYESNPDTNAYTNSEKAKMATLEPLKPMFAKVSTSSGTIVANDKNGDTLKFKAGNGVSLVADPTNKEITINASAGAADLTKLNGIQDGAEVNQNAYSNINGMAASSKTDSFTIEAGDNISITPGTKKITIASTATPDAYTQIQNIDAVKNSKFKLDAQNVNGTTALSASQSPLSIESPTVTTASDGSKTVTVPIKMDMSKLATKSFTQVGVYLKENDATGAYNINATTSTSALTIKAGKNIEISAQDPSNPNTITVNAIVPDATLYWRGWF